MMRDELFYFLSIERLMNITSYVRRRKWRTSREDSVKREIVPLNGCDVVNAILKLTEFDKPTRVDRADNKLLLEYLFFAVYSDYTHSTQRITIANLTSMQEFCNSLVRFAILFGKPVSEIERIIEKFSSQFTVNVRDSLELLCYCYARYIDYLSYCVFDNDEEAMNGELRRIKWIHHAAFFLAIASDGDLDRLIAYLESVVATIAKPKSDLKSYIYGRINGEYNGVKLKGRYDLLTADSLLIDFDAVEEPNEELVMRRLLVGARIINKTYSTVSVSEIISINIITCKIIRDRFNFIF